MIEIGFNDVGMIIFSCNHVKGYYKGKGKRLCSRCKKKIVNKLTWHNHISEWEGFKPFEDELKKTSEKSEKLK